MAQYSQRTQPMHSRNKWLEVIGRPDLLNKTNLKPQSYKICSVHFENSMMSEVLVRKLLPGAVPKKFLSTKSQPSTSLYVKESQSSEVSTQTKHSYVEELSVVKIKNAIMPMVHTQTGSPINERETQTSLALLSGMLRKRKLITQLQESERKKRRLQNELETTKKETDAKNSLSRSSSGNQFLNGDNDEVSEKFVKKVESSAGASVHYVPTLWYYKHLNFLSGKKDTDSDDSDSDHNNETVYVRLPRGQKRPPTTSTSTDQEGEPERDHEGDPVSSVDASAAAFGRSVGAQLHHLSKMQRCIAEKLISDVIYYAKMEQLSLDTSVNVKEAVEDQAATLIPKAGPSWYDTDLDNGAQESSFSCQLLTETSEDLVRREMEETASAVNFIKMERNDTESYVFQDDDDELNHAIDIVKEELM